VPDHAHWVARACFGLADGSAGSPNSFRCSTVKRRREVRWFRTAMPSWHVFQMWQKLPEIRTAPLASKVLQVRFVFRSVLLVGLTRGCVRGIATARTLNCGERVKARVINAGISGDTNGGMLAGLDSAVPQGTKIVRAS
jgi:hypothetical protein